MVGSSLGIVLFLLLAAGGVGYLTGYVFEAIALTFVSAVLFYLFHIFKLLRWLEGGMKDEIGYLPSSIESVAYHVSRQNRKKTEARQELRAIIERAQISLAALNDGVVLIDKKGQIEWWNDAAELLLGFQMPADQGTPITHLLRANDFVEYYNANDYVVPLMMKAPAYGDKHISIEITPFGDGESLMIAHDVTRMHRLETMRQEFIANVSHELKTPLTVISGYLEMLVSQEVDPKVNRIYGQMDQQAQRMASLVNNLLLLSKLETTELKVSKEPVSLSSLVRQINNNLEFIKTENQRITLDMDTRVSVWGNEEELYSAINNLMENALKYGGEKVDIRIELKLADDNSLALKICDNGQGIDPMYIPRLTERFFRVDASRSSSTGGSGIGLAIVKHVLKRHDARLEITADVGKGACFCCYFPESRVFIKKSVS